MARWTRVPLQEFVGEFHLGLVAFHMNSIERVSFSVNDGPWADVSQMSANPDTGVHEYVVRLDATDFADERVEVRAVAYPVLAGEPRSLAIELFAAPSGDSASTDAFFISPNGNDTTNNGTRSSPLASVRGALRKYREANGLAYENITIFHEPGTYQWGAEGNWNGAALNEGEGWLTLCPAPGVTREEVIYDSKLSNSVVAYGIRLKDITLDQLDSWRPVPWRWLRSSFWLDGCYCEGVDRLTATGPIASGSAFKYMTDCVLRNFVVPAGKSDLNRGLDIYGAGADIFTSALCTVDCTVDYQFRADTGAHPDLIQLVSMGYGPIENRIYYGIKATRMNGTFVMITRASSPNGEGAPIRDIAFVNICFEGGTDEGPYASNMGDLREGFDHCQYNHLLFEHCSIVNRKMNVLSNYSDSAGPLLWKNLVFRNNVFSAFDILDDWASIPGVVISDNHYIDESVVWHHGLNYTFGDPAFVNPSESDYRPRSWSPLIARPNPVEAKIPADADSNPRSNPTAVGALEHLD
ncbi:MAG: hypothetical protein GY904_25490 [Planctomycetaceae bacterium]|nr:hypothetical protein [Planctomycetaceae bacterium]